MNKAQPILGILGGMGPYAAVEFQQQLLQLTPALSEQELLPMVTWNNPAIPSRQAAILHNGPDPLPAIKHGLAQLNQLKVDKIAIPCNTAHYWYRELAAFSQIPLFNIIDETLRQLALYGKVKQRVGLIATSGLLQTEIYQRALQQKGYCYVLNRDAEQQQLFNQGCAAIKTGAIKIGGTLLHQAAQTLVNRGADVLILACTEVSLGLQAVHSAYLPIAIDSNQALARACIDWWQAARDPDARHDLHGGFRP